MAAKNVKIMMVKTDKGCFISDCYALHGYDFDYHKSIIPELFFDGKKAVKTYYPHWYFIEKYPDSVQKEQAGSMINKRFEIKNKALISDKMPAVIPYSERENYDGDMIDGLYSYFSDKEPNCMVDFPCDFEVLCEVEGYNFPPKIGYEAIAKINYANAKYTVSNADVQHQMLDKVIFPAVLLHNRPCKFSSKTMYDITRQYIMNNINNSVARITSDYDFCFEVVKVVPLIKPETVVFLDMFAKTKKEQTKPQTAIRRYDEVTIFSMTHDRKNYEGYPVIPEMCANSEEELQAKVDEWLLEIIRIINAPLCQCPNCGGTGYVGGIEKAVFHKSES